jgi:ABC-2 type transport system ATP-binding protein
LAQALFHDPRVLILDEPTDGLDPNQKHEVRSLIHRMAPDKSIIISTHLLEEVDAICTRAIIIAEGRIVADGTPQELMQRSRYHGAVRLAVANGAQPIEESVFRGIPALAEVERIEQSGALSRFMLFPKEGKAISHDVMELVRQKGWKLEEISVEAGHLDDVFRQITTKGGKRS